MHHCGVVSPDKGVAALSVSSIGGDDEAAAGEKPNHLQQTCIYLNPDIAKRDLTEVDIKYHQICSYSVCCAYTSYNTFTTK